MELSTRKPVENRPSSCPTSVYEGQEPQLFFELQHQSLSGEKQKLLLTTEEKKEVDDFALAVPHQLRLQTKAKLQLCRPPFTDLPSQRLSVIPRADSQSHRACVPRLVRASARHSQRPVQAGPAGTAAPLILRPSFLVCTSLRSLCVNLKVQMRVKTLKNPYRCNVIRVE